MEVSKFSMRKKQNCSRDERQTVAVPTERIPLSVKSCSSVVKASLEVFTIMHVKAVHVST